MSRRALDVDQLQAIVKREGNGACVDCDAENPMWASVTYGTLLCLEDAGKHRALGVQVSFVRSLDLDAWKDVEVASMMVSSNAFVNEFFALHGDASETIPRYLSLTAAKLRKLLARRREAYSESSTAAITGADAESASRDDTASASSSSAATAQVEELSAEETIEVLDLQERFATRALEREASSRDTEEQRPWVPDELAPICMLCGRTFTMILRKHHCRNYYVAAACPGSIASIESLTCPVKTRLGFKIAWAGCENEL
ncbi:Arf-GAP with GTPase, ANK repeat and PH domain-containing protein 2 [Hondaea fermentalgiana]|uniref:Arf-GAP with GTPase, ANK repeat and PH domain-containing protein 2 n=1 Tax=Hondaea fermentalgiana TaxID=2315210 RepID=A0A2R5GCL3_9STRA|nr:Arf-GAP with GTPase, ANK repeat and PH domain-containing protein 2 [Hondaea fermentalgiana]|eukprot:GBG28079.1 Arf-GAP with GTPase, ANK repeat and PH domain-containing protein 2 [Hondaea fermentalgiana]